MDNVNTLQQYIDAKTGLENILRRPGRFSTTEETNVLQQFYTATSKPSHVENINNALAAANSLPDSSEIKASLIDTINKLANHYVSKEEVQETQITMDTLKEYTDAKDVLENIVKRPGRYPTTEETNALQLFYTATSKPSDVENIETALAAANSLPDSSEIKASLIETITKLANHYVPKHETEQNEDQVQNDNMEIKSEKLQQLEEEKEKSLRFLTIMDSYEQGLFDDQRRKTKSFEERKKELEAKIVELESVITEEDKADVNQEFRQAEAKLKAYVASNNKEQSLPIKLYEEATNIPFYNNIIRALEKASELSNDDEMKPMLIDTLVKLDARYKTLQEEEDAKKVANKMQQLGIQPYVPKKKSSPEVENLREEIRQLEAEQARRIEEEKPIRENIKVRLAEIEEEKSRILQEKEVVTNEQPTNEVNEEIEQVQENLSLPPLEEEELSFQDKLEQIAEEGPIFVDTERRLETKEQYLTANNAQNLGKISPEEEISAAPKLEESLEKPHVIKSAKKVGIKLIEKVKSVDYSKKVKEALEWMNKHKMATGTALAAIGLATYLVSAPGELQNENKTEISQEQQIEDNNVQKQMEVKNQPTEEIKSETQIANEAIQEALNGVLNGEPVYVSASKAADNIDPKNTTERMRETSWRNANAGAYYDENAETLTREQAETKISAGDQVVVRYDNNGVPIGYVSVDKELAKEPGLSK